MANCLNCKKEFKERNHAHTYCSAYCQRKKSSLNYGHQKDYNPELNLDGEIWLPIDGYGGHYEISNLGRLRSYGHFNKLVILKLFLGDRGYYRKTLLIKGTLIRKNYSVHRLVAMAFIPNHNGKPNVNHIDGNKLNNRVENLEWVTQSENLQHAVKLGTLKTRGENNPLAKLKTEDVLHIRKVYSEGKYTVNQLIKMYNVSEYAIRAIITKRTWAWLV
jgi:hypothetical protein